MDDVKCSHCAQRPYIHRVVLHQKPSQMITDYDYPNTVPTKRYILCRQPVLNFLGHEGTSNEGHWWINL
eukprot:1541795-Pyramimonas_sp.AAC.1